MKRVSSSVWVGVFGLGIIAAGSAGACATSSTGGGTGGDGTGGSNGTGGEGGIFMTSGTTGSGGNGPDGGCDEGLPDKDQDLDGFTENEGDCNDCDPNVNPNAVEVIAEPDAMGNKPPPVDEDCNGMVDEPAATCDTGLALKSEDPADGAKAIGICKFMKSAKWVLADGTPPPVDPTQSASFHKGHGILSHFGTNNAPQEGASMLMLSSGTARNKEDAESVYRNFDKGYGSNPPIGFPKSSPKCPAVTSGAPRDATGLEVELDIPSNAKSVSFDFQFFTYEWGKFICQAYNDFFVAQVVPFPMGQTDGNIAFDGLGAPISVNNAFIDACGCPNNPPSACTVSSPNAGTFDFPCTLGMKQLVGTPFESDPGNLPGWSHGSTGWLRTTTPVTVGQPITIRFVTYDSEDGKLDSSTLIDNWHWSGTPGTTKTVIIPPK